MRVIGGFNTLRELKLTFNYCLIIPERPSYPLNALLLC